MTASKKDLDTQVPKLEKVPVKVMKSENKPELTQTFRDPLTGELDIKPGKEK